MAEIERLAGREIYRNRWMRVREDDIRRADGSTGVYGVVSKPDFALVLPWDGTAFHLVEQYRYPVGARYWEFPQGSWEERPDADPLAVARGELAEETGLRAARWRRLGRLFVAYGYSDQACTVLLATGLVRGRANPEPAEQGLRSARFRPAEVDRMILDGEIRDAPSVAAYALLGLTADALR